MGLILDTLKDVAEFSLLRNFRMRRNQRTAKFHGDVVLRCDFVSTSNVPQKDLSLFVQDTPYKYNTKNHTF